MRTRWSSDEAVAIDDILWDGPSPPKPERRRARFVENAAGVPRPTKGQLFGVFIRTPVKLSRAFQQTESEIGRCVTYKGIRACGGGPNLNKTFIRVCWILDAGCPAAPSAVNRRIRIRC